MSNICKSCGKVYDTDEWDDIPDPGDLCPECFYSGDVYDPTVDDDEWEPVLSDDDDEYDPDIHGSREDYQEMLMERRLRALENSDDEFDEEFEDDLESFDEDEEED